MINSSCAQNPYIPLARTRIKARPPMIFPEFFNGGSVRVVRQVCLTRRSKVSSPLFHAKPAVMFNARLLHSTVHSNEHVADCNHVTVQRGRECDDYPFQTGYKNRHRPYRTRVYGRLFPPISMTSMRLGGRWEVCCDGRPPKVVLKGGLGWVVGQERIDGYGYVG